MKNRIFKGLKILAFQIGVNVIGIPVFEVHQIADYKISQIKKEKKYHN